VTTRCAGRRGALLPKFTNCHREAVCAYVPSRAGVVDSAKTQDPTMQPASMTTASPIPVPDVDSDAPVAVIPTASVAPLDGEPDGERINVFTVAPKSSKRPWQQARADAAGDLRQRVLGKPLTSAAIALSLGFLVARVLR
jgi:hypothetical protein